MHSPFINPRSIPGYAPSPIAVMHVVRPDPDTVCGFRVIAALHEGDKIITARQVEIAAQVGLGFGDEVPVEIGESFMTVF